MTSLLSFVPEESKGLLNKQLCAAKECQRKPNQRLIHRTRLPKEGRREALSLHPRCSCLIQLETPANNCGQQSTLSLAIPEVYCRSCMVSKHRHLLTSSLIKLLDTLTSRPLYTYVLRSKGIHFPTCRRGPLPSFPLCLTSHSLLVKSARVSQPP